MGTLSVTSVKVMWKKTNSKFLMKNKYKLIMAACNSANLEKYLQNTSDITNSQAKLVKFRIIYIWAIYIITKG